MRCSPKVLGLACALLALGVCAYAAQSGGKGATKETKPNPAFERMKKLAGDWEGTASFGAAPGEPAQLTIKSTAGGSALVEIEFPGTDHEMMSMIYVDKGEIVLTHYCHLGNQPHMKGKLVEDDEVHFEFASGANIDPKTDMHMHAARYQIIDEDLFTSTWTRYEAGKPGTDTRMEMKRKRSSAAK